MLAGEMILVLSYMKNFEITGSIKQNLLQYYDEDHLRINGLWYYGGRRKLCMLNWWVVRTGNGATTE